MTEYQTRLICARNKYVLRQDDTLGCIIWYGLIKGGWRGVECFAFASNPVYVGWWKIGPESCSVEWLCVGILRLFLG